jgi:hypothetical protein
MLKGLLKVKVITIILNQGQGEGKVVSVRESSGKRTAWLSPVRKTCRHARACVLGCRAVHARAEGSSKKEEVNDKRDSI